MLQKVACASPSFSFQKTQETPPIIPTGLPHQVLSKPTVFSTRSLYISQLGKHLLLKPSCQVMLLDLLVVWNGTHFLQKHVNARRRSLQTPHRIPHVLQLASCEYTLTLPAHMQANTCISSYLSQLYPSPGPIVSAGWRSRTF